MLANVNTPGYRKLDVSFDDALSQHLMMHGEQGVGGLQPTIVEDFTTRSSRRWMGTTWISTPK